MEKLEFEGAVIRSLMAGPLMTNYYVVGCTGTKRAVIVDGGFAAEQIVTMADDEGLSVEAIWQTHAHIDHVAALGDAKRLTKAPIYLHPDDRPLYDSAPQQGRFFGYDIEPLPSVDYWLEDGQKLELGELSCEVLLLPGHSPGCVAFWFEALGVVVSGDVLFAGSIGRVDLPGSDPRAMKRSLERMTETLSDDTVVLCGHGPRTTIGLEKKRNPFLLQQW